MSDNPDVHAMVKAGIESGGFDGLYNDELECACLPDDLAPCGEICDECTAGYKVEHKGSSCEICEVWGTDADWHIQKDKP